MTDSARPEGGLSKLERLCGKREIATLLENGRWGGGACLRFCCRVREETEDAAPDRMMVSVPKKHFKRAVRRNLLKRRIREAYRLQKSLLHEAGDGVRYDILFTYTSAEVASFEEIRAAVATILTEVRGWRS